MLSARSRTNSRPCWYRISTSLARSFSRSEPNRPGRSGIKF